MQAIGSSHLPIAAALFCFLSSILSVQILFANAQRRDAHFQRKILKNFYATSLPAKRSFLTGRLFFKEHLQAVLLKSLTLHPDPAIPNNQETWGADALPNSQIHS